MSGEAPARCAFRAIFMVVDSDGEDELGRPRYSQAPEPWRDPAVPGGGGPSARTAQEAYDAITFASFAWIIPLFGGIMAIRRGNRALRAIANSGGALGGISQAVWARRLGWLYIALWVFVLYRIGLLALVFVIDVARNAF
jgi:hypothetical protein